MTDVIIEKKGHTALMTLNRPSSLNALCEEFMSSVSGALDEVLNDSDIYTLIITGSGKAFISGADIKEMYGKNSREIFDWSSLGSGLNMKIETMEIPVIAAINGYAFGGGLELAMACDIRIASENAVMGLPETGLGVICGAGGTQRLPRLIGESAARELIFTASSIDAGRALSLGLVSHVVPGERLLEKAFSIAGEIEKNGQLAVRAAKKAVNAARNTKIEDGCLLERRLFSALFDTEDQKTGMGAFIAGKKNVVFKNR
ncbi:MAG TPA: enoyl-CoA hydratase/isomerase family protein [Candidatus Copromorpha excrementigallinarum]|uniref:short-chain-enoyl-CoA hydratase n=1 Tax=Candidatus Allocopromorpha excrementigallinarum TaxID=2840742 RepID=A0A9D1I010_9FIRM|nr:enoyl-CoA hydratase/isomerase family protein [Candidatus Copromorpha excrementigallinarum]